MSKRIVCLAAFAAVVCAVPAAAQDHRAEVGVVFGWTFSDGVEGDETLAGDGQIYNRVDSTDSFKWALDIGVLVTENAEVGFLFGQQLSTAEISGTTTREVGDLTVSTYHGYFAYNFGDPDAIARPYIMGGLGATNFGSVDYTTVGGASGSTNSGTQFSSTWGAGVKVYPRPNVGVRFGVQWTPTYIKSDAVGWWCDPFWGCYLVGDAQYSNQFDLSGGVTFRF